MDLLPPKAGLPLFGNLSQDGYFQAGCGKTMGHWLRTRTRTHTHTHLDTPRREGRIWDEMMICCWSWLICHVVSMQTKATIASAIEEAVLGLATCHTKNSTWKVRLQTSNGQVNQTGNPNSRSGDQASLIYILTTCHSAPLAEEVTWAPLPPSIVHFGTLWPRASLTHTHIYVSHIYIYIYRLVHGKW